MTNISSRVAHDPRDKKDTAIGNDTNLHSEVHSNKEDNERLATAATRADFELGDLDLTHSLTHLRRRTHFPPRRRCCRRRRLVIVPRQIRMVAQFPGREQTISGPVNLNWNARGKSKGPSIGDRSLYEPRLDEMRRGEQRAQNDADATDNDIGDTQERIPTAHDRSSRDDE